MLRTLASYFYGDGDGAAGPDGPRVNETSTVELMVARELSDELDEDCSDEDCFRDDDWVLVDEDGSEVDDEEELGESEEEDEPMKQVPATTASVVATPVAFGPAPRPKVKFQTQEPEVTSSTSAAGADLFNDNNNSIHGSVMLTASGLLMKRQEEEEEVEKAKDLKEQVAGVPSNGHVDDDQDDDVDEMDTDFAWENSLIEHPSVYIASHHQRRCELEEEKRLMSFKKPKRKSGRRRLGRMGRPQQPSSLISSTASSVSSSRRPSTSTTSNSVIAGPATLPDEDSVARMGRPGGSPGSAVQATAAPAASHNNNNGANGALEFLDVLKLQQEQQLLEQRRRGSGKRKQCIRDSRVHQNSCNKPPRRCDKQNYTRHSRMNNDRKCNKKFC